MRVSGQSAHSHVPTHSKSGSCFLYSVTQSQEQGTVSSGEGGKTLESCPSGEGEVA